MSVFKLYYGRQGRGGEKGVTTNPPFNTPSCDNDNTQFSHVTHSVKERKVKGCGGQPGVWASGKNGGRLVLIADLQVDA